MAKSKRVAVPLGIDQATHQRQLLRAFLDVRVEKFPGLAPIAENLRLAIAQGDVVQAAWCGIELGERLTELSVTRPLFRHQYMQGGLRRAKGAAKSRNKRQQKVGAHRAKIRKYVTEKLHSRGKKKQPSITAIRQRAASEFNVSVSTVLRVTRDQCQKK